MLTKQQLMKLIPIWEQLLELRGTLEPRSRRGYVKAVQKFLLQDLPYTQYIDKMYDRRPTRTPGHDKTAIDQFYSFLLVCHLIKKHPDPNYKVIGWGIGV